MLAFSCAVHPQTDVGTNENKEEKMLVTELKAAGAYDVCYIVDFNNAYIAEDAIYTLESDLSAGITLQIAMLPQVYYSVERPKEQYLPFISNKRTVNHSNTSPSTLARSTC